MRRTILTGSAILIGLLLIPGCALFHLAGGMAQNAEYQKLVEVLAEYGELENRTVAVVVNSDLATLYEHPQLSRQIAVGLSVRLQKYVPGIRVVNPDAVLAWQFNTTQWNAMPYGDIPIALGVERVVFVDLFEYRLHPRGNSLMMEGVCAASIGIIERGYIDPDSFTMVMDVTTTFPKLSNMTRDEISAQQVEFVLLSLFIRDSAWLFHSHVEPKYPGKFQGSIPEKKS